MSLLDLLVLPPKEPELRLLWAAEDGTEALFHLVLSSPFQHHRVSTALVILMLSDGSLFSPGLCSRHECPLRLSDDLSEKWVRLCLRHLGSASRLSGSSLESLAWSDSTSESF